MFIGHNHTRLRSVGARRCCGHDAPTERNILFVKAINMSLLRSEARKSHSKSWKSRSLTLFPRAPYIGRSVI